MNPSNYLIIGRVFVFAENNIRRFISVLGIALLTICVWCHSIPKGAKHYTHCW